MVSSFVCDMRHDDSRLSKTSFVCEYRLLPEACVDVVTTDSLGGERSTFSFVEIHEETFIE